MEFCFTPRGDRGAKPRVFQSEAALVRWLHAEIAGRPVELHHARLFSHPLHPEGVTAAGLHLLDADGGYDGFLGYAYLKGRDWSHLRRLLGIMDLLRLARAA